MNIIIAMQSNTSILPMTYIGIKEVTSNVTPNPSTKYIIRKAIVLSNLSSMLANVFMLVKYLN